MKTSCVFLLFFFFLCELPQQSYFQSGHGASKNSSAKIACIFFSETLEHFLALDFCFRPPFPSGSTLIQIVFSQF